MSSNFGYGYVRAIFSIVKNACCILAGASAKALLKFLAPIDSKIVGNKVVFSLQIWEMLTAAEVLKISFVWVWYMFSNNVATFNVAN